MATATTESVREFVMRNFYVPDPAVLDDSTSLIDSAIVDSTGVLEITAFLESEYGIHVADDEIVPANLDTIARIVAFANRKAATAAA